MLADWDHFDNLTPEQRDDYSMAARRLQVLADLDAFRQRLDGRADTSHPSRELKNE